MKRLLPTILVLVSPLAFAQNRCIDNGKLLITDRPCVGQVSPAQPPVSLNQAPINNVSTAYGTPYGTWRGQVQLQATGTGGVIHDAMSIVPMTIDIASQGMIKGSSPENGCSLKGIAAPGMVPTSLMLDITLSGCRYADFNRRLHGVLSLNQAQKYALISLRGSNSNPFGMVFYDIKGTMRR